MRILKVGGVVVVALIITTLGISASDMLTGGDSVLTQLIGSQAEPGPCPTGMLHVPTGGTFSCVDQFEASPAETCPHNDPVVPVETIDNIVATYCTPVSVSDKSPWTFVTREQAAQLCARAGKRLPTAAEWYHIAIDTPAQGNECNLDSTNVRPATAHSPCRSAVGAIDTVGNVWEWVSDDVVDGSLGDRQLPKEGYVAAVDSSGIATEVARAPQSLFAADYLWTEHNGAYGVLRGGYFGSKSDGGVYAVQAKTKPTAATAATGFRCVR